MKSKKLVGIICMLVTASVFPIVTVSVASDGNVIYVDDDGGADYTNIQDAIDAADDGDTVYVYKGTYHENLQIDKTIFLTGEDKSETIIYGENSSNVVKVTANSVNIEGFSVKNGFDTGIYVFDSVDTSISDCIITSNSGRGIHLDLAKKASISHCIISSNEEFGICVCNSDGSRPGSNNNVISHCIISNNSDGVFLDDITGTSVENNTIKDNRFYGVYLVFARDCEIKENNFIDNTESAFFQGGFFNSWSHNYWSGAWNIGIKLILGVTWGLPIPWLNFDLNPATEPFEIDGGII
ncbi:MAG: right-handed parallel beta-helix repeat-containing protein [Thermoplasmatales archaeon]|nr:right-handed parallel beta-helix repeat-containing protein [Thermoplasmatales archaeon]